MHEGSFNRLIRRFAAGRPFIQHPWGQRPTEDWSYGPVTIADSLSLYNIKTKSVGVITHIGDTSIGMSCIDNGHHIVGSFSEFFLADDNGKPLPDTYFDIAGNEIMVGAIVSFAATWGSQSFRCFMGRVIGFTKSGGIKVENITYGGDTIENLFCYYHRSNRTVRNGDNCVVLSLDSPNVIEYSRKLAEGV